MYAAAAYLLYMEYPTVPAGILYYLHYYYHAMMRCAVVSCGDVCRARGDGVHAPTLTTGMMWWT